MADAPTNAQTSTDVAKPSDAHHKLVRRTEMIRTLMGGTHAMRDAGEKYLPKEKAEDATSYQARLNRSVLFGATAKTVEDMTGKIFAKPIVLKDNVPANIKGWCENIDNAGRHLNVFARDVFFDGMQTGITFVLTDMQPKVTNPDGSPATLAQEQAAGLRPYLTHIKLEDFIGWKSAVIGGVPTLTQIRIRECVTVDDGDFAQKDVEQIRVIEPGTWRIYQRTGKRNDANQEEWGQVGGGTSSIKDKIPLAVVYFNRCGFMDAEPPLSKLAELNVTHWQSSSDQRNIVHVARVPILFGAGFTADDSLVVGISAMCRSSNPSAKLEYVEHSGHAISAGQTDLDKLELQMQVMGLQLTMPKPSGQSATGELLDNDKENSPLAMMATALQDGIEISFGFMAQFASAKESTADSNNGDGMVAGGEVEINKDFGVQAGRTDLQQIVQAFVAGLISGPTARAEMQRRNFLSDSFDEELEAQQLEDEQAKLMPKNPLGDRGMGPGGLPPGVEAPKVPTGEPDNLHVTNG